MQYSTKRRTPSPRLLTAFPSGPRYLPSFRRFRKLAVTEWAAGAEHASARPEFLLASRPMTVTARPALSVALVGAGRWGSNILRVLRCHPWVRHVLVCDPVLGSLSRSIGGILADENCPLAVVATPPASHGALASDLLAAGKQVLIEKPMTLSTLETARLRSAMNGPARVMVGHLLYYHPAVQRMLEVASSGAIGRPQRLICQRGGGARVQLVEHAWWALAPHDVALAPLLLGEELTGVSARMVRDAVRASGATSSGLQFQLDVLVAEGAKQRRVCLVGDSGRLTFDDAGRRARLLLTQWHAAQAQTTELAFPADEPLAVEIDHFLECSVSGAEFSTGFDQGATVVRHLEQAWSGLALESYGGGSRVSAS